MTHLTIGFIGLGNMGNGMATHLQTYCSKQEHTLLVMDLDAKKVATLVQQGAQAADDLDAMVSQVDLLLTSLPSSKEINGLAFGNSIGDKTASVCQGILKSLPAGATWIDTSTNDLSAWQQVKDAAPDHLHLLDGPVTGGAEGAAAGTVTMLLGCSQSQYQQWLPVLSSFTGKCQRMGESGAGYATKLVQLHLNYLVAQGIGEALMLGAKAGIDLPTLHAMLQNSCAQSYVVDSYIPKVLDGSYDGSFALGLAEKDLRLINAMGDHLSVTLPLGKQVYDTYQQATATYGFDAPHLSVVRLIEEAHAKELR